MLIVTVAASVEPVTLAEAKEHLRVTDTNSDTLIGALITAAREAAELATGRALAAASYRWPSEDEVTDSVRLPLWPVDSVSEVSYEDADGARQTMDSGDYTLDGDRARLSLDEMPASIANLSVTFAVDPPSVSEMMKSAIKLMVEDLFTNTGGTVSEPIQWNPASERILYLNRVNLGV